MNTLMLLADDDASVRSVFSGMFAAGPELLLAADGTEALALLKERQPAVAFLDVDMPGLTGLEVMEAARGCCPDTVIWVLTAHEDIETVTSALALGAAGYLTKPFETARVREIVKSAMEKKGARPWSVKNKDDGTCR